MAERIPNLFEILNSQKNNIETVNHEMKGIVRDYNYIYISKNFQHNQLQNIIPNIQDSQVIVIDFYQDQTIEQLYYIIGFQKTILMILNESLQKIIKFILQCKPQIEFSFISEKSRNIFDHNNIKYKESTTLGDQNNFENEIDSFNGNLRLFQKAINDRSISEIWRIIISCISGYKIKQSYSKLNYNRLENFEEKVVGVRMFNDDNTFELRRVDSTICSEVKLKYDIKNERLLLCKMLKLEKDKKLQDREIKNYSKVSHPFLPKFYGVYKNNIYTEFIKGQTLSDINEFQFKEEEEIIIIFQIILIFDYLHKNNFVYRDLKPNNIMIDQNKDAILIDLDRMIDLKIPNDNVDFTKSFCHVFIAPEVNNGQITVKNDIFSIGQMIYYILFKKDPNDNCLKSFEKKPELLPIYEQCTNLDSNKRPTTFELMFELYSIFYQIINESKINNLEVVKYFDGILRYDQVCISKDISQTMRLLSLSADLKIKSAAYVLGFLYRNSDMEKAIHYLSIAAIQNHMKAQYNLGYAYIQIGDVENAIHYFELASKHEENSIIKIESLHILGVLYYKIGKFNKSIEYLDLAANFNHPNALRELGILCLEGKVDNKGINESLKYLIRSAKLNCIEARRVLGVIYFEGKYIERNINKAIKYLKYAADQNDAEAQFRLGCIYYTEIKIINKAIHYLTLAANQNYVDAYFELFRIYHDQEDKINEIHYLELSAKSNNYYAQHYLSYYYWYGKHVKRDVDRAINYLSNAAEHNIVFSQYLLGIYYFGNHNHSKAKYYVSLAARSMHIDSIFYLGIIYYKKKDIDKSISCLSTASKYNHSKAAYFLGNIYRDNKNYEKAFEYYKKAADKIPEAQYNLGVIYYNGISVPKDIDRGFYYFSLAASNKIAEAQYNLGVIYFYGISVPKDIDRGFYYFSLAASKIAEAQLHLGVIYYYGISVPKDIDRGIYYFSLAASNKIAEAQYNLGITYLYNKKLFDFNKAIHYLELAANQGLSQANYQLGDIYYNGKYVEKDFNKAYYYFSLSADQNNSEALYMLGMIHLNIKKDTQKALFYLNRADKQNNSNAQKTLGFLYSNIFQYNVEFNMNKAIDFFTRSSKNHNYHSSFFLGLIYSEGKFWIKDINKAVHYYKDASNFNHYFAKNNLAVIYRHGIDKIQKNVNYAIELLKEACKMKEGLVMYNLAHIYIFEDGFENKIDESIDLLFESISFEPAIMLLCIILIKKYGFNFDMIEQIIIEKTSESNKIFQNRIIKQLKLFDEFKLNEQYKLYQSLDFLFGFNSHLNAFASSNIFNEERKNENKEIKDLTSDFYDGFGL